MRTEMIELLRKRRSIRKYRARPVDAQSLETLKEALLRAPTSRDGKAWEFVFVDNPDLLGALSRAKPQGADFLKDAPLGIVIAADERRSDVWVEDAAIAAILVQVAAESVGLGSCWIQIRNRSHDPETSAEAFVQRVLGIPEHVRVLAIISLGHPDESKPAISADRLDYRKIRLNHYARTA